MTMRSYIENHIKTANKAWRFILPVLILIGAFVIALVLFKTAPSPQTRQKTERAVIVETTALSRTNLYVELTTAGTVSSERQIHLFPRVAGTVNWISPDFIPGGKFKTGEVMLEIDSADYQLALTNSMAALAQAEYALQLEMGMQAVAQHELEAARLLNSSPLESTDEQLAARVPHLRLAQSNLASAQAMVKQAQLNLDRTKITAPFNAVILSKNVDIGSQVSTQTMLAELAGTDTYRISATIPAGSLQWINAAAASNRPGSAALIKSVSGNDFNAEWKGFVLRKMADVEPQGKLARILIEIPQPDAPYTGEGTLLIGAYVQALLKGSELINVFTIPRTALREGDKIWIAKPDNRLDIRKVDVIWSDRKHAVIENCGTEGECLIISDIGIPVQNMLLKLSGDNRSAKQTVGKNGDKQP